MKALLYLLIFTVPLGADVLSLGIGSYKLSLFRAFLILAAGYALYGCFFKKKRLCILPKGKARLSVMAFYAWWIIGLISVIWAKDIGAWIKSMFFISVGAVCVILFNSFIKEEKDFKNALLSLQMGILLQSLIGWYEVITRMYWWVDIDRAWFYSEMMPRVPVAMQGNPNDFSVLMLAGMAVSLMLTQLCSEKMSKTVNNIILVSYGLLLLLTRSRASILGLVLFVCAWIFLDKRKKWIIKIRVWLKRRKKWELVLIICSFSVIALSALVFFFMTVSFNFAATDSSDSIRMNLIKNGFVFLFSTFGLGVGAGQIEHWMANNAVYSTASTTNMHNYWMEILTGYGVIVFVLFAAYYFKLFFDFYKQTRLNVNSKQRRTAIYICAFTVGFAISCIGPSSMIHSEWLWIFLGLLTAYQNIKSNECLSEEVTK